MCLHAQAHRGSANSEGLTDRASAMLLAFWASSLGLGIAEQCLETFLLKMPVVGENLSQPFLAHRLH